MPEAAQPDRVTARVGPVRGPTFMRSQTDISTFNSNSVAKGRGLTGPGVKSAQDEGP